jgi:predicted transcriptional regulator
LAHVATKVLSAEVASQDALIKAVTAGVAVEDVGEVVPDGIDPVI